MADGHAKSIPRREDDRLITGRGHYTADLRLDGLLHAVFVRSPYASATLRGVDCAAALAAPGVVAIYTAADLDADGRPDFSPGIELVRPDGSRSPDTTQAALVRERVRHVGEPVAMVVAETEAQAIDAAELVFAEYDELPAIASYAAATAEGAFVVWDAAPDNVAFGWRKNDMAPVEEALRNSAHVARLDSTISRVSASPLEPRNAIGAMGEDGRYILYVANQKPYYIRDALAEWLGVPPERVRVVAGDVGGSFGMKIALHVDEAMVVWAAAKLGRPVKWVAQRTESFLSDEHGRDMEVEAELGLDADGRFTALKARYRVNVGAYLSVRSLVMFGNIGGIAGVYRIGKVAAEIEGVMTNTQPVSPYRGAGRPEATYTIERLIDIAARETGIDPFALRRRNLIPPEAMPYDTGFLFTYDCGDFASNMAAAEKRADRAGFAHRREDSARRGKLRGLGVANPIEVAGGPLTRPERDNVRIRMGSNGTVTLLAGAMSVGQGLETALSRLVAERLGVPIEQIDFHQGDTDTLPFGHGNGGSSGMSVGGTVILMALDALLADGAKLAGELLEAEPGNIRFAEGRFAVPGANQSVGLAEVARLAEERGEAGLTGFADHRPERVTFPNGCHVCEVEIDPETGTLAIVRYTVAEDIGRVYNPNIAHGQLHGGIAQGIGQAIQEVILFDEATAQLLSASFMDYAMPRAGDIPEIGIESLCVPTKVNPLGAKGVGEAGAVGSLAATINAVCDALAPLGISHIEMPATPARIWAAIQAATGG